MPMVICTTSAGRPRNNHTPKAIPNGIKTEKRMMIGQFMCFRNSQKRQIFAANCTEPWNGIAADGGMNCNSTARRIAPPPAPATEVIIEVKNDVTVKMAI